MSKAKTDEDKKKEEGLLAEILELLKAILAMLGLGGSGKRLNAKEMMASLSSPEGQAMLKKADEFAEKHPMLAKLAAATIGNSYLKRLPASAVAQLNAVAGNPAHCQRIQNQFRNYPYLANVLRSAAKDTGCATGLNAVLGSNLQLRPTPSTTMLTHQQGRIQKNAMQASPVMTQKKPILTDTPSDPSYKKR